MYIHTSASVGAQNVMSNAYMHCINPPSVDRDCYLVISFAIVTNSDPFPCSSNQSFSLVATSSPTWISLSGDLLQEWLGRGEEKVSPTIEAGDDHASIR